MVSFWIDYGTNFIGGTGDSQSEAAWRIPLALQLVPAIILGVGILFMPFSPRWLVNQGREDEALRVLSRARNHPEDSEAIQIEFLCVMLYCKFGLHLTATIVRSRRSTCSRRRPQLSSTRNGRTARSPRTSSLPLPIISAF